MKLSSQFKIVLFFVVFGLFIWPLGAGEQGLYYSHFFLADQTSVHLLTIDPEAFDLVVASAEKGTLESVEAIARKKQALAAINGGFFQMSGLRPETPKGILKIDKKWYGVDNQSRGAIGWLKGGVTVMFNRLHANFIGESEKALDELPPWNIWVSPQIDDSQENADNWNWASYIVGGAPLMIYDGKLIQDYSQEKIRDSYVNKRHARTAVGVLSNGHWLFLVVDGKKRLFFENLGITIPNLASLMFSLGCVSALNLDGGGSSTMVLYNEVVNEPCGEISDKKGHKIRDVSNALLVVPKKN